MNYRYNSHREPRFSGGFRRGGGGGDWLHTKNPDENKSVRQYFGSSISPPRQTNALNPIGFGVAEGFSPSVGNPSKSAAADGGQKVPQFDKAFGYYNNNRRYDVASFGSKTFMYSDKSAKFDGRGSGEGDGRGYRKLDHLQTNVHNAYHWQPNAQKFDGQGTKNWQSDARKSNEQRPIRNFSIESTSYTKLPPETLSEDLFTVHVRDLPSKLTEKGLFNFFKCFGFVVNIFVAKPSNAENVATQSASISFKKYLEAMEVKRLNGTVVFGSRIFVEFHQDKKVLHQKPAQESQEQKSVRPKSNWKSAKIRHQNSNWYQLPAEILLKVFESLDFLSRSRGESVCRKWRSLLIKNFEKLPHTADEPKDVTLAMLTDGFVEGNKPENKVTFNKEDKVMTIKIVKSEDCKAITGFMKKILRRISGGVVEVQLTGIHINKDFMLNLEKYCAPEYRLTCDDVNIQSIPLNFLKSMVVHFGERLTITPARNWPVAVIL